VLTFAPNFTPTSVVKRVPQAISPAQTMLSRLPDRASVLIAPRRKQRVVAESHPMHMQPAQPQATCMADHSVGK
jgi:hypothetical protein